MGCPECQCEEIGASGTCLWCGYETNVREEGADWPAAERNVQAARVLQGTFASAPPAGFDGTAFQQIDFIRAALSTRYYRDRALLSARSLSGCIDLGIVTLSTGLFALAAFLLSDGRTFARDSIVHYSFLFLLVHFLYSLYFQGTSNRTIGMMVLGLRIAADTDETRPEIAQIVGRSCLYLVSLFCAGAGLIWACYDQEQRCLHDRLTNTRVVWK
jgi:uncharacterized RDD family membrane protein YckC